MSDHTLTPDILRVRDHTQPCEHTLDPLAMYDGAYFDDECGYWRCGFGPCPGGREIVLRRPSYNELRVPQAVKDWMWVEVEHE